MKRRPLKTRTRSSISHLVERRAKKPRTRHVFFEQLESRRQLASILLSLDSDILTITDSATEVVDDHLVISDNGVSLQIDLGPGETFDASSTGIDGLTTGLSYSAEQDVVTIAKSAFTQIQITLDDHTPGGPDNSTPPIDLPPGQDLIDWQIDTVNWAFGDPPPSPPTLSFPLTSVTTDVLALHGDMDLTNTLTLTAALLTVNGAITGPANLAVTSDAATFDGLIGTIATPFGAATGPTIHLTTLNSGGTFDFLGTLHLSNEIVADIGTTVNFTGNVVVDAGDSVLAGNVSLAGIDLSSQGDFTFGTDSNDELRVVAGTLSTIHATSSNVSVNASVVLEADLSITTTTVGNITLNGPVNGLDVGIQSLSLQSDGITSLNGTIGGITPLKTLTTDVGGSTSVTADVNVEMGNATFNDPVTLVGDRTFVGRQGSPLRFANTLDGGDSLTLDCDGGTVVVGDAGTLLAIGDGSGTAIGMLSGTTTFQSKLTTASGVEQFATAGLATFQGDVSIAEGDTPTQFHGNVKLEGIVFTSDGDITFGDDDSDTLLLAEGIATSGVTISTAMPMTPKSVTVNSATTLAANVVIATGAGSTTVNGPVDDSATGTHSLEFDNTDMTTLNGVIGQTKPIQSLTTDAGGVTNVNASIFVDTGDLVIGDPVVLKGDIVLEGTNLSGSYFADDVTKGASLTLNFEGPTTFASRLGGIGGADSLGDGSGPALILLSTGTTDFTGAVATASGISQAETAGLITFEDEVTVAAGDTASTFLADVTLSNMHLTSAGNVQFGTSSSNDKLTLAIGAVQVTSTKTNGLIDVNSIVDGPFDLTLDLPSTGTLHFYNSVGATDPLQSLTVTQTGSVTFDSNSTITSNVDITSTGDVIVNAILVSATGNVLTKTTGGGDIILEAIEAQLIDLRSSGSIKNAPTNSMTPDLQASSLRMTAATGIGSLESSPLRTSVDSLSASNSSAGNIRIVNERGAILTIETIDSLNGIHNGATGGLISLQNDGVLDVLQPIDANGSITIRSLVTGDSDLIRIKANVASTASTIDITTGDDFTLAINATLDAAGTLTLASDATYADGSTFLIAGDIITAAASSQSLKITTGSGGDAIQISGKLSTGATTAVDAILLSSGDGADTIALDSNLGDPMAAGMTDGGTVSGIRSRITISAGSGVDEILLDNSGKSAAQAVTITPTVGPAGAYAGTIGAGGSDTYFVTGVFLTYDATEDVTMSTGSGNDLINATAYFNSATARQTNFNFAEDTTNSDQDTLLLDYSNFPLEKSPFVLVTTTSGRALADIDANAKKFGALRWDDIETITPTIPNPNATVTVPHDALFLSGRTSYNDIARYTGTTALVALAVNGINFEEHANVTRIVAYGRTGNDRITVDAPSIAIACEFRGEQGADYLSGAAAADEIYGDWASDATGGKDTIFGQGGNDTLKGFAADDLIYGNLGDDTIDGGAGNDVLYGNEGNDIVRGGLGNDVLYGISGNDVLLGDAGSDKLYAGNQRSLLIGGAGTDYLYGQVGDMLVGGSTSNDANDSALLSVLLDATNSWVASTLTNTLSTVAKTAIKAKLGTVTDTERDYLTGSTASSTKDNKLDWFFSSATDVFSRKAVADLVN